MDAPEREEPFGVVAREKAEDARVGVDAQRLPDDLHGEDFPVVEGGGGAAPSQPPIPEDLLPELVYQAVDGYNELVRVHGVLASHLRSWSTSMVEEPADPGQKKLAHRVSFQQRQDADF